MNDEPIESGAAPDGAEELRKEQAFLVHAHLQRSGMKQKALAEAVGMTEVQLSRSLKSERRFKDWELVKIREVLEIPVSDVGEQSAAQRRAALDARRDFARRLRERRETLGWSVDRVARGIIDIDVYEALEAAEREPTVLDLELVAPRLGVSLVWLITGHGVDGDPPNS